LDDQTSKESKGNMISARRPRKPRLTVALLLQWADAHQARTGQWPKWNTGVVTDAPWPETWSIINFSLGRAERGLPGGITLRKLLVRKRGAVMPGSGRHPDHKRRQVVAEFRASGLNCAEIGRRLGVSKQAIWRLLNGGKGKAKRT